MSLPGFFLALLMLYYFGSELGLLPIGGLKSPDYDQLSGLRRAVDMGMHLIIPTTVLAIGGLASLQRIMRGNMLEVLRMQYVTTARAKGLPENRVIYRHALRNAINPMVTIFGFEFSSLLSGAALLEIVCGYPGLGQVMLEAVRSQDIFLVMGSMLIGGVMLVAGNLIADVLLAIVDPQVSYQ
jgi:peptide/nickel transport system permease protein